MRPTRSRPKHPLSRPASSASRLVLGEALWNFVALRHPASQSSRTANGLELGPEAEPMTCILIDR